MTYKGSSDLRGHMTTGSEVISGQIQSNIWPNLVVVILGQWEVTLRGWHEITGHMTSGVAGQIWQKWSNCPQSWHMSSLGNGEWPTRGQVTLGVIGHIRPNSIKHNTHIYIYTHKTWNYWPTQKNRRAVFFLISKLIFLIYITRWHH